MKTPFIKLVHVVVLGLESLTLLGLLAWVLLRAVQPTGWTSTGEGDLLRFRFTPGQDELIAHCACVQVAFTTKECPKAFENPELTIRKDIPADDPYGWIEIPAPIGSRSFRFDVHPIKGCNELEHGPEVAEMHLGNQRISWSDLKSHYQYDKTWYVPCYWYQPMCFFNLSIKKTVCLAVICLAVSFLAIGAIVLKMKGGDCP